MNFDLPIHKKRLSQDTKQQPDTRVALTMLKELKAKRRTSTMNGLDKIRADTLLDINLESSLADQLFLQPASLRPTSCHCSECGRHTRKENTAQHVSLKLITSSAASPPAAKIGPKFTTETRIKFKMTAIPNAKHWAANLKRTMTQAEGALSHSPKNNPNAHNNHKDPDRIQGDYPKEGAFGTKRLSRQGYKSPSNQARTPVNEQTTLGHSGFPRGSPTERKKKLSYHAPPSNADVHQVLPFGKVFHLDIPLANGTMTGSVTERSSPIPSSGQLPPLLSPKGHKWSLSKHETSSVGKFREERVYSPLPKIQDVIISSRFPAQKYTNSTLREAKKVYKLQEPPLFQRKLLTKSRK